MNIQTTYNIYLRRKFCYVLSFYHFKSFYNVQQSETKSGFSLQCSFGMDGGLFAALLYSINHTSKIHSNSPQYLTAQVTCHKVYRSDEYTWYSF